MEETSDPKWTTVNFVDFTICNIQFLLYLAEDLLNCGLSYVGNVHSNTPRVPDAVKASSKGEVHSSLCGPKDRVTPVSCVLQHNARRQGKREPLTCCTVRYPH